MPTDKPDPFKKMGHLKTKSTAGATVQNPVRLRSPETSAEHKAYVNELQNLQPQPGQHPSPQEWNRMAATGGIDGKSQKRVMDADEATMKRLSERARATAQRGAHNQGPAAGTSSGTTRPTRKPTGNQQAGRSR